MTLAELLGFRAKPSARDGQEHDFAQEAFRAEDTPVDLMTELAAADYSHLPELRHAAK